jgi:hypothetical protein
MTFPTDAAMITRRKSFGTCGPAIVVSSFCYFLLVAQASVFLDLFLRLHRFTARAATRAACGLTFEPM